MDRIRETLEVAFSGAVSEVFAIGFLCGFLVFLIGLLTAVFFVVSRLSGFRTSGTVIGAIEVTRIKVKTREGERFQKIKASLFPVYEYRGSKGELKQTASSEGGTFTKNYTTGQAVNLIVRENEDRDDVSDAGVRGILYLGLVLLCSGGALMAWVGSIAASLGVSVLSILTILLLRGATALVRSRSDGKRHSRLIDTSRRASIDRSFTPEDLKPIEDFQ